MHMPTLNSLQEDVMGSPVALQSWVAGHQYGALMRGGIWEGEREADLKGKGCGEQAHIGGCLPPRDMASSCLGCCQEPCLVL